MKLSDYVMRFVADLGVKHVFMIPGGGAMHLNDSLGRCREIEYVCNLHEQASAIAAENYAKLNGHLGVALVTTGPGGTNAVTGVAGAWLDSIPCLFLSGQVKRPDLKGDLGVRQVGVQEVDIVAIVKPITKYAVLVLEPGSIRYHLEKAVASARSGRPGPVWIDIPLDVQAATIDPDQLQGYASEEGAGGTPALPGNAPEGSAGDAELLREKVGETFRLLNQAERPVLLAGHGIRLAGAVAELHQLVERLGIPLLTTWLGMDMVADRHPLFMGRPGPVAPRGANFTLQNADWLLTIGARLDHVLTAYAPEKLARGAKKIMVDIDAAEVRKLKRLIDVPVVADAGAFIREALRQSGTVIVRPSPKEDGLSGSVKTPCSPPSQGGHACSPPSQGGHACSPPSQGGHAWDRWVARCREWKKKYPIVLAEHRGTEGPISIYRLAEILSDTLGGDDVVVSGSSGSGIEIFLHAFKVRQGQRVLFTTALGAMGFGLPASIGACLASGRRRTVCVDGDGGFQLNIQELATVARLNLPIKFFLLNNNGFASIRTSQRHWFDGRVVAADPTSGLTLPDITKVAAAYGLTALRIEEQRDLPARIRGVLDMPGPVVCDLMVIPDEGRVPRVSSMQRADGSMVSMPLEDLFPFLPRDEFLANMIVPPIEP